jgi:hypothetical protein
MTETETPQPSRWEPLPGDPPALRRWLAIQAGDEAGEGWPQERPS